MSFADALSIGTAVFTVVALTSLNVMRIRLNRHLRMVNEGSSFERVLLPRELYDRIALSEGMIAKSPREVDTFVSEAVWEKLEGMQ